MILPASPDIGKEEYLSKSKGIDGKLRKKPEDFVVDEIIQLEQKCRIRKESRSYCIKLLQ